MSGLRPLSFFNAIALDYFMIPFLGDFRFKSHATSWQWLLNLRRERGCPRCARTSEVSTSKNKCRGFAPYHFSLLSLWKVNFPRSINEKCPIKGHLFFVRRERDSNPRTCDSQRFSRPPHSTALPSLRRKSKTSKPNYKEIIKKTSKNSSL